MLTVLSFQKVNAFKGYRFKIFKSERFQFAVNVLTSN